MRLGKSLQKAKWFPAVVGNQISMRLRKCSTGKEFTANGLLLIRGKGDIQIGDNVTINSCRESNPIGGDVRTILFTRNPAARIRIGNNVGISNSALIAMNEIVVEDNVLIGGGCKIYDSDFHALDYKDRMERGDLNVQSAPVRIKQGAFIGAGAFILKGVTIGAYAIVGAGSVVTKSIPDGEVWAGNPARMIGRVLGDGEVL